MKKKGQKYKKKNQIKWFVKKKTIYKIRFLT